MTPKRKRTTRPSARVQRVETVFDEMFDWLKLDESAKSYRALRAFARAAGPRIGAQARAERLRGAILYVRVSSAAWSHELSVLKSALIDKIRRTPGGERVMDLRFSVGPLEELPDWESAPPPPPNPPVAPPVAPPETPLPAALARVVEGVKDPELREEIAQTLRRAQASPLSRR